MLVGVLMINVIAGLYQSEWGLNPSPNTGLAADGQFHAFDDTFPPPPSFP